MENVKSLKCEKCRGSGEVKAISVSVIDGYDLENCSECEGTGKKMEGGLNGKG